jgi:hypothetical protein
MRVTVTRVPTQKRVTLNIFSPKRQRGMPITMKMIPHNQEYSSRKAQRALRE